VVEAAVVGGTDELRGEIPIGFVVLKTRCNAP
jgi:acyl-coenzyme A synthetase/AMP-(fatty) acid ligase